MPTPWPSWTIACSKATQADEQANSVLKEFQSRLQESIKQFTSPEKETESQAFIEQHFSYKSEDVKKWWAGVRWVQDQREPLSGAQGMNGQAATTMTVSRAVLTQTLDLLQKAGVVKAPSDGWDLETFAAADRLAE